ncbi:MAG: ABC transporter substrate-binding protein, partial [Ruegeria sp.]|nr:ABC transporter substrate-binding protein [Ruegeria sp.]
MKVTKSTLLASAVAAIAGSAMAEEMTLVSWGGAYQASQTKAYA